MATASKSKDKKFRICRGDGTNCLAHGETIQEALEAHGLTVATLYGNGGYFQTIK